MTWRSNEAYVHGLEFFGGIVARVPDPDWEKPSPCAGWRVLDVLGHVGAVVDFGTRLLRGEKPAWEGQAEVPGSVVGTDPRSWWAALVDPARESVAGADLTRVVDSPMGPRTIEEGLSFPAIDLFVHGWDVGRGAGLEVEVPDELIEFANTVLDPLPEAGLRSATVFAEPAPAPAGATASQAFIAWTGRDPHWTST